MKTILKIISIIILAFPFGEKLYSQATSTQGTDFWLSFGRNWNRYYSNVNLQVRIVTSDSATVTFTYTESGIVNTVSIAAGSVYTHVLTDQEKYEVYSFDGGKSSKSLHIESDVPVSVYALNQYNLTADATNILPLTGLGTDYYHIAYKSNTASYGDGYTVIATEDNTEIYEDGILQDTLQKGQVYSAYFGVVDVTGKHITSSHPTAYFVTNGGVWLPLNSGGGSDCLYQQLISVNKWGNNFLVPVTHRGVERIRIVASQDSTVITQTGGTIVNDNGGYSQNSLNLDRGQFVELVTTLDNCGCYISSNKPVGVCTYLIGTNYNYYPYLLDTDGDPAIAWVPPIEQSINGALIAPFIPTGTSALNAHYALIVTPTATKDQTTMTIGTDSATSLTGGNWCDNAISNFSFYSLPLYNTTDAYYFANPHGLTVMGYGIGHLESYYYLAGSASRDLDAAFYVNNIHYQDLDTDFICDTAVNFRASIQYAMSTTPGYLKWFIDSIEQISVRDTLEWSGTLPVGIHNVYIEVLDMENDTITLSSTFGVNIPYYDTINATICMGKRYFDDNFDTIPTQAGFISLTHDYTTTIGCDSIFTLNLTVNPSYHDTIIDTICLGDEYIDDNFHIVPTQAGFIDSTLTYSTTLGCDSIFILHLTVNPSYHDTIIDTICLGNEYIDDNFHIVPTQAGFIDTMRIYSTTNGCDSIFTLNLTVNPSYHDTVTATICLGDEYIDDNFHIVPTQAGFIDSTLTYSTTLGCDSAFTLYLTVHPVYDNTIYAVICLGEKYEDDNFDKTPTVAGIVKDSVNIPTVIYGCDSIIRLHLTVNQTYYDTIIDTICLGEIYNQYNFNETPLQSGNFTFVHDETTAQGCDSITTLFLTVNRSYYDTIKATICQNEYYSDYGFYVVAAQWGIFTYVHNLITSKNCDSITTLLLTVNPSYYEYRYGKIYEDEFYTVGNYKYNTPGLHVSYLQTTNDCDSIITLNLNVIYYPYETAFSPFNKDGVNDYFMPGFKVQILNRNGTLIYETKTVEEQELGWDGRNTKGQNVEPGVYFYILYNSSGKPRTKSSVEVIKR
ncbi:MAG: gliding motility-associated C-terminal domain-containing protein [Prevotellaceae bacterium]|jgi:hypothetical protein|nr:gliding motility-associated C-terminal domain-containing protein [Prevotellaceae bacterium]